MKRRRLLRVLLVAAAIALFTGYFAFSTLLFNPLESRYALDVATLVPRDVDFFFAKEELAGDFDSFPRLALADELEASEGGSAFLASERWTGWRAELGVAERLEELDAALAQLPLELEPLSLLGGRELALAGRLDGAGAGVEWMVLARTGWIGKLAFELLPWLDLEAQGLALEEGDVSRTLSGGQLGAPLHFARIQDVLIAGTSRELVEQAVELEARAGEDSLFLSARYYDHIARAEGRSAEDLEYYFDLRATSKAFGWSRAWPDRASEDYGEALAARLFQLESVQEVEGVLGFPAGVSLSGHGEFSVELLSDTQRRLFGLRDFSMDGEGDFADWASWAPARSALFAYAHLPVGDLLTIAREASDEASRGLVDDAVRSVWGYADAAPLIQVLDACFEDEAALVVAPNRFLDTSADAPLNNGDPVLTWALIMKLDAGSDREGQRWLIDEVREKVMNNQAQFGIQGRSGGPGVFTNTVSGGYQVYEYHIPSIPGSGHLSSIATADGWFLLSNHHLFLGELISTHLAPDERPPLSGRPEFNALRRTAPKSASMAAWWNPREAGELLREQAAFQAEFQALQAIDWATQRPHIEREVLKERFGNRAVAQLDELERDSFKREVSTRLTEYEARFRAQWRPRFEADGLRRVAYQELLAGSMFTLSLSRKEFEFYARAIVPLD